MKKQSNIPEVKHHLCNVLHSLKNQVNCMANMSSKIMKQDEDTMYDVSIVGPESDTSEIEPGSWIISPSKDGDFFLGSNYAFDHAKASEEFEAKNEESRRKLKERLEK